MARSALKGMLRMSPARGALEMLMYFNTFPSQRCEAVLRSLLCLCSGGMRTERRSRRFSEVR